MSPVPEKKQSIAGMRTLNMRGVEVEGWIVEPTTEREGVVAPGSGKEIEVITMCGMRYCSCSVLIASLRLSMSTILMPLNVLFCKLSVFIYPIP